MSTATIVVVGPVPANPDRHLAQAACADDHGRRPGCEKLTRTVDGVVARQRRVAERSSVARVEAAQRDQVAVPQTMAMTYNADDVVAARAGRNSPNTRRRSRHVGLRHYPDSVVMSLELLSSADAPWTFISPLAFRASPV